MPFHSKYTNYVLIDAILSPPYFFSLHDIKYPTASLDTQKMVSYITNQCSNDICVYENGYKLRKCQLIFQLHFCLINQNVITGQYR